ncbi:MAG: hypothetical protein IJK23_03155 [Clostridia bacterium]|nr:hypothetical protein [Clostridia bacterium]
MLFGKYPLPGSGQMPDPISWLVLDETDTALLLFSECVLDFMPFTDVFRTRDRGWIDSDIRKWLNGDFYEHTFSEAEKKRILPAEHRPVENRWYVQDLTAVCEDRVFLLDIDEVYRYLSGREIRKALLTPYARSIDADEDPWWWTRSCGVSGYDGALVHSVNVAFAVWHNWNGEPLSEAEMPTETETDLGIRPALWLRK